MAVALDEYRLYKQEPIRLTDKIVLRQPTLGEIFCFGETDYYDFVHTFTATTMDESVIVFLTDLGIDFNHITNYQLFMLLIGTMPQGADLLFENHIDFSSFKCVGDTDTLYLQNADGIVIDETIYNILVIYLRAMNNIPTPKITRIKDDPVQKEMAIEDARNQLESRKRKEKFNPHGSALLPIISSMVNASGFKHDEKTVFDMGVYAFWDSVKRISAISNANHLYQGLYSGCISLKENPSLKKEMDWMRTL